MLESLKNIYIRQCLGMIESLDFVESSINQEFLSELDVEELKRTLHTIKGGAAALNYQIIQIFAQQGESLVEKENDLHRSCLVLLQIKEMLLRELNSSNPLNLKTLQEYTAMELKTLFEDLAKKVGKRIQVEVVDDENNLNRLNEEFFLKVLFPVMINAIDHGIENESERLQSKKYFIAQVRLQISSEAGVIKFLFSDDGRGDLARTESSAETAEMKTSVPRKYFFSGSGLGLQIMSEYVKKFKGEVKIDSIAGQGSYIRIEIPESSLSDQSYLSAV